MVLGLSFAVKRPLWWPPSKPSWGTTSSSTIPCGQGFIHEAVQHQQCWNLLERSPDYLAWPEWYASMEPKNPKELRPLLWPATSNIPVWSKFLWYNSAEIIFDVGGASKMIKDLKRFRPCPMGGCLPKEYLITNDYEELAKAGSLWVPVGCRDGWSTCMVDIARFFMNSFRMKAAVSVPLAVSGQNACLKYCSVSALAKPGRRYRKPWDALRQIVRIVCAVWSSAPNPVVSTLKHFRDEYEAHIYEKTLPG